MKLFRLFFSLAAIVASALPSAVLAQKGTLRIAAIDVEGGQATLFVSPSGHSLLVDTGWGGFGGRDANRIATTAKSMGVSKIDAVLITHYHDDHAGGIPELIALMPVGEFLDHGDRIPTDPNKPSFYVAYRKLLTMGKYKHVEMKAGEKLPVSGFDATAISSGGQVIQTSLGGDTGANPLCANAPTPAEDTSENGQSLGFLMRFAGLTIVDAGDLTADREKMLMCPQNKLGKVDLLIVSHHGVDWSSSPLFIDSIAPRVAVMDNGAHKGGSTSVIDTIRKSPRLEALYQLHPAPRAGSPNPGGTVQGGPEHNVPDAFLANTGDVDGKNVLVTIHVNGTMDVTNERTGETKHFARP